MSTKINTNLNCSSNGCSLAALQKHITTCLQRWHQKQSAKSEEQRHNQPTTQNEKNYSQFQQNFNRRHIKQSNKEYSIVKRTAVCCKSFNSKFQKFITRRKHISKNNPTTVSDTEGPRHYGRRVQIAAKLLSSTLIAKRSSVTTLGQTALIQSSTTTSRSDTYEDRMTVMDLTFLELRTEYPDINSEIRSILTSRAQEGATISEIRDDYRKLTGLTFPLYEDVTEFLLTIPHVTAYCSEQGTRIFNIRPIEKTKHIHDMVMQQKPQLEALQRPAVKNYYRERVRNSNYQPLTWRLNSNRRLVQNNTNADTEPYNNRDAEPQHQLIPSTDINLSNDVSNDFSENNFFYQDNCNHLLKRIYNLQQETPSCHYHHEKRPQILLEPATVKAPPTKNNPYLNNFDSDMSSYNNNMKYLNNFFQPQYQQERQSQPNLTNVKSMDRRSFSINPSKRPAQISSSSSSPATKNCNINDSAFTNSDYDAHLLDFLLMGDDFFLYMARMELNCKFKKNERILQSGLCVSGQKISDAIKRIRIMNDQHRSIIINIGSVDIIQGRQLIQIEHDFRELLLIMLQKGMKPILTTLAPVANYSHNNEMKHMLDRFNNFVKREALKKKLVVIDIWSCLVNEKRYVLFDCYQNEPRNVTGTSEPYLFWNKIGRQRVLKLIESKLEY